jgi:hypothetical protein
VSVAESIARPSSCPCAGKCGLTWKQAKDWITCWFCPGRPLALCPECGRKHLATAAHKELERAAGRRATAEAAG